MASRQQELRALSAVKLYELGFLSSGRAAEMAGMGRVEFLLSLARHKVFPLEAELRDLEAHRA
jgi:predicted HTH domain antitoxin